MALKTLSKKVRGIGMAGLLVISSFLFSSYSYNKSFTFSGSSMAGTEVLAAVNPFSFNLEPAANLLQKLDVYDSLQLGILGLNFEAFQSALRGMERLVEDGYQFNSNVITIADFSQPSYKKRLYVVDLNNYQVLFNTYVSHGRNSGKELASRFSNRLSSYQSSPGFYLTGNTYSGKHGYSLQLEGLEKGINDNARRRAIVLHGANYVDERLIARQGYIGRSQGCPAVSAKISREIIGAIKDGTCLFIYSPDPSYLAKSAFLN